MFGKVDQMRRDEVEARLSQLLGSVVEASLENKDPADLDLKKDGKIEDLKIVKEEESIEE